MTITYQQPREVEGFAQRHQRMAESGEIGEKLLVQSLVCFQRVDAGLKAASFRMQCGLGIGLLLLAAAYQGHTGDLL